MRSRKGIPPMAALIPDTRTLSSCDLRLRGLASGGMPRHPPHLVVAQRVQQPQPQSRKGTPLSAVALVNSKIPQLTM